MGKKLDLTGQKFGKLFVLNSDQYIYYSSGKRTASLCQCDCGNMKIASNNFLIQGVLNSCGCLVLENAVRLGKDIKKRIRFEPKIVSARRVFRHYKDGDLSFEEFFHLSQQNCLYCGQSPQNKQQENKRNPKSYLYGNDDGVFIYNGLDRIDSTIGHTKNNVVTCCSNCNYAKNNMSLEYFKNYVTRLFATERIMPEEHRRQSLLIDVSTLYRIENYSLASSVRSTFNRGKGYYKDGGLKIDQFYQLTQLNCFYCNLPPSNINNKAQISKGYSQYAKDTGNFIYNGLDRLDNALKHNWSNVVACCKRCNFAKSDRTFDDFLAWIDIIEQNYDNWQFFGIQ